MNINSQSMQTQGHGKYSDTEHSFVANIEHNLYHFMLFMVNKVITASWGVHSEYWMRSHGVLLQNKFCFPSTSHISTT